MEEILWGKSQVRKRSTAILLWSICLLVAGLLAATGAWAKPTTPEQATAVVQNWLAKEATPMGSPLGGQIREVQTFNGSDGNPAYYVVFLNPSGLVFVPADDQVEPIIGFVGGATSYDPSPGNRLGFLVGGDIPARVLQARQVEAQALDGATPLAPETPQSGAQSKWSQLLNLGSGTEAYVGFGAPTVSDMRVAPFIQSLWGWTTVDGNQPPPPSPTSLPCYNYFTPPYTTGGQYNYLNYPVGGEATAELMRFWQYPTAGVGTTMFTITVNGGQSCWTLRGGDGLGGPYDWANMPLDPANPIASDLQRQAIGNLTHDIDLSLNMDYEWTYSTGSDGSGSYTGTNKYRMADVATSLVNTFKYGNAKDGGNNGDNVPCTNRDAMIIPNLLAGYPVAIGETSTGGGVFLDLLVDGYGYNYNSLYYHIHIGYTGYDAWFTLPLIYLSTTDAKYQYNLLTDVIYNVYPSGSGEIIAGRVIDTIGNPVSGATVTATRTGGGVYSATTNAKGNYAIVKVPSASNYSVIASKPSFAFAAQSVPTGTSTTTTITTGNVWGVDFAPNASLSRALDNYALNFSTSGSASWFEQKDTSVKVPYYGPSCAQSGAISTGQSTSLQTTLTGPGTLNFYWSVSCYPYFPLNQLILYLDGVAQGSIYGAVGWTQKTLQIPAGTHTVTWTYSKNANNTIYSDCGWVDKVVFNRPALFAIYELLLLE